MACGREQPAICCVSQSTGQRGELNDSVVMSSSRIMLSLHPAATVKQRGLAAM